MNGDRLGTWKERRIAILTFDCIDEWLDETYSNLDTVALEMGSGWFNCLQALEGAGVHCVLYGTSSKVTRVTRIEHKPTGAIICLLPSSSLYNWWKRQSRELGPFAAVKPQTVAKRRVSDRIANVATAYMSLPVLAFLREVRRDSCECILVEQYGTPRFDLSVLMARIVGIPVFGLFACNIGETNRFWGRLGSGPIKLLA